MRMKAVQSVVIMLRILVLFLIAANCFINAAYAETVPRLPSGDFSELRRTGMVNVKAVIDPQTIQLEDGHIVRLTGIDFPDFNPDEPGDFSLTAMQILRDMLVGKTVLLYQTVNREEGRINRMGQDIAQIQRESDKAWVQGTLLSLGLARVRTAQRNPEMAQQMYDLEQTAMKDKAGIWENYSKVLPPEEAEAHEGSFQIVEGRIESAALKQNRIYLNFGKDWKTDFTISIAPEDKRAFSKQNLDPLQVERETGARARVDREL
ncbi:MAG: thermonuclease family protein [Micavibrio sp.]|nr:thermonuclease family protein [Micavibrio sp.]